MVFHSQWPWPSWKFSAKRASSLSGPSVSNKCNNDRRWVSNVLLVSDHLRGCLVRDTGRETGGVIVRRSQPISSNVSADSRTCRSSRLSILRRRRKTPLRIPLAFTLLGWIPFSEVPGEKHRATGREEPPRPPVRRKFH